MTRVTISTKGTSAVRPRPGPGVPATLFDAPAIPLSGSGDPETSHAAEARQVSSGRLSGNRRWVLALVVRWPGRSFKEYFELCVKNATAAEIMLVADLYYWYEEAASVDDRIIAYAELRATIQKRLRDLFELDLVERRKVDGELLTSGGAVRYWPTARGVALGDS